MTSTSAAAETTPGVLQEMARRHLWMHFTRLSAYDQVDVPIIVRGEGVTSTMSTASATSMGSRRCSA